MSAKFLVSWIVDAWRCCSPRHVRRRHCSRTAPFDRDDDGVLSSPLRPHESKWENYSTSSSSLTSLSSALSGSSNSISSDNRCVVEADVGAVNAAPPPLTDDADEPATRMSVIRASRRAAPIAVHREIIGRGTYGVVRRGRCVESGDTVAVKMLPIDLASGESGRSSERENEVRALRRLTNARHVIRLRTVVRTDAFLYLVLDYACGGTLEQALNARNDMPFAERDARLYFAQILDAVDECHAVGVVHHDVALKNMLLTRELTDGVHCVRLCDFGLAQLERRNVRGNVLPLRDMQTTPLVAAPEILFCRPHTRAVDVWAAGVALFRLLAIDYPFDISDGGVDARCHAIDRLRDRVLGPTRRFYDGVTRRYEPHAHRPLLPIGASDDAQEIIDAVFTGRRNADLRPTTADLRQYAWMN